MSQQLLIIEARISIHKDRLTFYDYMTRISDFSNEWKHLQTKCSSDLSQLKRRRNRMLGIIKE